MKNTALLFLFSSLINLLSPSLTYGTEINKKLLRNYVANLQSDQHASGAFYPANCLDMAMTALGTIPTELGDEAIRRSIKYLKKVQSENGGFGESPDSFLEGKAVSLKYSS